MKKSIKRLPKRTQEELTVLLDLVRKSIGNCQMVILFGSYARGNYVLWDSNIEFGVHTSYQSDYDILVVITGPAKQVEEKLHRITNKYHDLFADRRHAFPQFIVEHINTVNRNLEVSQYFFTDIVKEGIMLYNSGKHELAKPRKLQFRHRSSLLQELMYLSFFNPLQNLIPLFFHLCLDKHWGKFLLPYPYIHPGGSVTGCNGSATFPSLRRLLQGRQPRGRSYAYNPLPSPACHPPRTFPRR